jgi:hypothetical protein
MEVRRRVLAAVAAASAAAVVGAFGSGLAFPGLALGAAPDSGVTFSSQPGVATLVTHYVVSPTGQQQEDASASNDESRTSLLAPKRAGSAAAAAVRAATSNQSAGAKSDNTVTEIARSDEGGSPTQQPSFIGQQASAKTCSYFATGCNPPDMALAASSDFVLQGVNTQFEVLDTSGNVQPGWPVGAQKFFGIPNATKADGTPCDTAHHSQPFTSDPRALFDTRDHRFWAAVLQVENTQGLAPDCAFKTAYFIAVSQTSDPTGSWNVYEFDMSLGQPFAADFMQLGMNADAVYFSANMFSADGSAFPYAELFEANKAKMERGQGGFTADGFFNLRASGPGITAATGPFVADTVQPALNLDNSAHGAEVFVDTFDGPDPVSGHNCSNAANSCQGLALWRLTNPVAHDHGGGAPVLTGTYVPGVRPYVFTPPADQPSCNQCIDASDLRISGTPVVRDGTVYAAWETAIDNGTQIVPGIEWTQVRLADEESATSARSGYYDFSGDAAAVYPAVMPDASGNLLMAFDYMSNTVSPQSRYIVRKRGQSQFTGAGVLVKAAESPYRPTICGTVLRVCRWGDYSAASSDGQGSTWFAGQYANQVGDPHSPPTFGRNWGTWIGAVGSD